MSIDYAVIGGGIAGLYAALHLAKRYPNASVAVYEKYNILGGRVLTYRKSSPVGPLQWEEGAGRIHESHTLVRGLLKTYGLREAPLGDKMFWKESYDSPLVENPFEESLKVWLPQVATLDKEILEKSTLHEILIKIFGTEKARELTIPFPYYAEVFTLRGDLAIESFQNEMGTHSKYYYSPDGYDKLIQAMAEDCKKHKVQIHTNWDLKAAAPVSNSKVLLWFATGPLKLKDSRKVEQIRANHAIFALHQVALQKLNLFKTLPLLKTVKMEPLHRIYAVFPKPWFQDIPRFSTATPIRYFIPIDPKRGIVMISYTDGADTHPWTNIAYGADPKEETLGKLLTDECRKLFQDRDIPYPTIVKSHPWDYGCSYWLPGDYKPSEVSKQSLQPFGDSIPIYICGESFSMRQAWMEGALENTRDLLRII